ncbi:MAG: hypothetical protein J7K68_02310 [Candidatus Diapherotrites archaeon]|nr:hypothetical protein [Candidatus Diapherotrites archaeon]
MQWKRLKSIEPCTTDSSKVSGDFLLVAEAPIDMTVIKKALEKSDVFHDVKLSFILKTLKAKHKSGADIMIFKSGRVDIMKADDEEQLYKIMDEIVNAIERVNK